MNEILTEQTEFLKDDHEKVHNFASKTSNNKILPQIAIVVQNVFNNFGSILVTLYLLSYSLCTLREEVSKCYLISALLFGVGICTLVMALCSTNFTISGCNRLGYLVCLLITFETNPCPKTGDTYAMGPELRYAEWLQKLNELQGGVMITCGIQLFFSLLDMNFLTKFVRPITIAPTMILIGLFITKTLVMDMLKSCWYLSVVTIGLMFCLHCIVYNCSNRKQDNIKIRNRLYVGVICAIIMWSLCALLSMFELIWVQSIARTDVYTGIYNQVPMFRYSFPFQWGIPEWKSESVSLVVPAAFITVFEILGNFHQNQNKKKNVNEMEELLNTSMLIKLEAILCLIMNSMGVVIGLNVGVKKKNGRVLDICSAVILIIIAFSGSLCAFFTTIPEPIIGALILMVFLSAVLEGFNMLKSTDLNSVKNVYILGVSIFMAFFIPICIEEDLRITGKSRIDRILRCLLSTDFIVVGFTALFLDNLFRVFTEEPTKNQKFDKISISSEKGENSDPPQFCDCFSPFFA